MHLPTFYHGDMDNSAGGPVRTVRDIAIVLAVVAAVIAIAAHAPSDNYAYAQLRQMGAVVSTLNTGNWLLPRNQEGRLARKGQLYAWLDAPLVWATGVYSEFVFRLPTVAASLATGVLVYLLGKRWYGRRAGLLAACLWAVGLQMGKLTYIATTDMLLTVWITASIFCADRLVFHPAPSGRRLRWVIGLWTTLILGVLTKGWGIANLPLVGGMIALAAGVGPGFQALRGAPRVGAKVGLGARLVGRRWWGAIKATHLFWGLVAVTAVLVPLWLGMLAVGGEEFRQVVRFEVWQRMTGEGEDAPPQSGVPPVLALLYFTLPASVFAVGAMLLAKPGRWFSRKGPLCLPLCWILGVLLPYSLVHGFRPDYLLPCYAAVALMGGWGIEELVRRVGPDGRIPAGDKSARVLRHVFAAVPVAVGAVLVGGGLGYLLREHVPSFLQRFIVIPGAIRPETWWLLGGAVVLGAGVAAAGVWASLRWRIRIVAGVAVVGMLGASFLDSHFLSRHARTGDGEKMLDFARRARPVVGADQFAVLRMEKLCAELYLGRFGNRLRPPEGEPRRAVGKIARPLEELNASSVRWLMTCDRGLIELGAAMEDEHGQCGLTLQIDGRRQQLRFRVHPEELGEVRVESAAVSSQRWGRMYLIELRPRPIAVSGTPVNTGFIPGMPGD